MIPIFDMVGGKPVPTLHCQFIPTLKAIRDNFPDDYLKVYAYVFYKTCPDGTMNPYVNVAEEQREEMIISNIKPDSWLEDMSVLQAIDTCEKMYETPTLRAFKAAKKMIDKVAKYLDEQEITDGKDGNGMLIDKFMKSLSDYKDLYDKLEVALREEQAVSRGKVKVAYDMTQGYTNTKGE